MATQATAATPPDGGALPFDDEEWDQALNPFQSPEAEPEKKVHNYDSPKKVDRKSLRWVRRGLTMVNIGLQGMAVCILLFVLNIAVAAAASASGTQVGGTAATSVGVIALLLMLGYLICGVLLFVGPYFCVTVPEKTGARGPARTAAIAQTTGFVLGIVLGTGQVTEPTELFALTLITLAASLTSYFSFLSFMSKLATFIGRSDIAGTVSIVVTLGVVIGGAYGLLIGIGVAGALLEDYQTIARIAVFLLGLTVFIAGLMALVLYARAVHRLSRAI
ncbi:MAG: hypothetical protein AAGB00_00665 [Planctomycetota bacterium]